MLSELNMNMLMYIIIMAVLISIAISIRIKNGIIFKMAVRFVLAICLICSVNYISQFVGLDITVPLNPVTASLIAFLQVPGIALIYITKFAIYPM